MFKVHRVLGSLCSKEFDFPKTAKVGSSGRQSISSTQLTHSRNEHCTHVEHMALQVGIIYILFWLLSAQQPNVLLKIQVPIEEALLSPGRSARPVENTWNCRAVAKTLKRLAGATSPITLLNSGAVVTTLQVLGS